MISKPYPKLTKMRRLANYYKWLQASATYVEELRSSCQKKCMTCKKLKFLTIVPNESYTNNILVLLRGKKFFKLHA